MNARWTLEEEKKLIKSVKHGENLDNLAKEFNRSENALELRIKKIIYDTISEKKSLSSIAKSLNYTEEKVKQLFYSYKDMMEKQGKKTIDIDENNKDKKDDKKDSKKESKKTRDIKRGENKSINMDKLKKQNEQMSVILKHIELKKEIKKALKSNKFSDNEIKLIKSIF
jgi:hypothetical protein